MIFVKSGFGIAQECIGRSLAQLAVFSTSNLIIDVDIICHILRSGAEMFTPVARISDGRKIADAEADERYGAGRLWRLSFVAAADCIQHFVVYAFYMESKTFAHS